MNWHLSWREAHSEQDEESVASHLTFRSRHESHDGSFRRCLEFFCLGLEEFELWVSVISGSRSPEGDAAERGERIGEAVSCRGLGTESRSPGLLCCFVLICGDWTGRASEGAGVSVTFLRFDSEFSAFSNLRPLSGGNWEPLKPFKLEPGPAIYGNGEDMPSGRCRRVL